MFELLAEHILTHLTSSAVKLYGNAEGGFSTLSLIKPRN
jgi:hypothetical protein